MDPRRFKTFRQEPWEASLTEKSQNWKMTKKKVEGEGVLGWGTRIRSFSEGQE